MRIRIDAADRYFSLFVRYRANWRCEFCLGQHVVGSTGLHASHFYGRARESVRFDPENVSAHCFSCHVRLGSNPEEHRAWKLNQIGQKRYDALMVRANLRAKRDRKLALILARRLYEGEKQRFEREGKLA